LAATMGSFGAIVAALCFTCGAAQRGAYSLSESCQLPKAFGGAGSAQLIAPFFAIAGTLC
jgi:hypothetical protein